jgi:ATP citrate (pro-S)-lyase
VYKFASSHTLPENIISILLGKRIKSEKLVSATDLILKLLIDHSPQVSGAVNTMISARAGKDLVSSLASGLLTIGPRFGGAINQAAQNWLNAVKDNTDPEEFVENFAKRREYIQGIGHKKYRSDNPDPRVEALSEIVADLQSTPHLDFAHQVEKITTSKKANLVLNVDGAIAALLLDLLYIEEEYPHEQLQELVDTEFFNALFVLSRSIGFTAHYLDQRRQDEGLFRLPSQELELLEEIK